MAINREEIINQISNLIQNPVAETNKQLINILKSCTTDELIAKNIKVCKVSAKNWLAIRQKQLFCLYINLQTLKKILKIMQNNFG